MPTLINPDQTGYVKGRYIGENIRLIYDLIHYTDKTNQKGIAIFLDFKKAFDSIEWNYLLETLQLFNFGSTKIPNSPQPRAILCETEEKQTS